MMTRAWLWFKYRFFPGRWTQEEIDSQSARAHAQWLELQKHFD